MIAIVGHAIIRHRLMDIRVVIKRSAVYLVAFIVAGLTLLGLVVGSNALFDDDHAVPLREILLALAVAVLFHPLKTQIQRAFDRYLYREPYDYQRVIRESSRALGRSLHLPTLLEHVGQVIHRTLRPEGLGIYLLDSEDRQFSRAFPESGAGGIGMDFPQTLAPAAAIVATVLRDRRQIFGDEVGQAESGPAAAELLDEFLRMRVEVVVPLLEEDEVIGLLLVGPKRSGDPYFSDDADLLTTLANQSAVAIHNALAHQQVVRVSEEIQKILGTIDSGVVATGARGRVSLFNRAAERMTGMPSETVRGNPAGHLPAPLARLLEATIQDGQPRLHTEISLPTGTGQLVPLICSTTPLRGSEGSTVGAVAVFSDLSHLKELEAEKRRAERLASLEAIASGMVHEIRNPLVAIKTFSQLFPQRFADAGFRESFSRVTTREIARIEELLDQFRNLASTSSQPMEMIEVLSVVQATLETLQPELETRKIRLRQVADEVARPILGNASQLQQLFHNLCLNAIEAMGEGGELTVRVVDLSQGGNILLVEISDTGCGIPDDLLPRIFDPFVSTKARGTGLGLAICRGIADAHRATLRARNNSGRPGSTFTLEFPVPSSHRADVPR